MLREPGANLHRPRQVPPTYAKFFRQRHKNDSRYAHATAAVCLIPPILQISLFGVVERHPPELR